MLFKSPTYASRRAISSLIGTIPRYFGSHLTFPPYLQRVREQFAIAAEKKLRRSSSRRRREKKENAECQPNSSTSRLGAPKRGRALSEAGCQPDSSTSRPDAPKRGRPLSVADENSSPKVQQQRVRKIESFIPAWAIESSVRPVS